MSQETPQIITFGCRLNAYESRVIAERAREAGLTDAVIVNTCAVTAEAERQARQAIRRARRERPGTRIIVTGCAAQIDPETYAAMDEVDRVIGNEEKLTAAALAPEREEPVLVADIMTVRETAGHLIGGFEGRARAFVQVQQGCDHRCTFCIIPFGRGNSRSVPMGPIFEQVGALVAGGTSEVVLTGVDITAYGADLPGQPSLGSLVRRLLDAVPGLERLRLTSLDPVEIDDELFELIAGERRLMPHLHLSLQSGDDLILKRMKRRHLRGDAVAVCERVRRARPDIAFGADLIAGFPTESEAAFANTLALIEDCGLAFLHVFPYSARPGTPAARMRQVPGAERRERAARLRQAGDEALARFLASQPGRTARVLLEQDDFGRTEHYAPIRLEAPDSRDSRTAPGPAPGSIVEAHITGSSAVELTGRLAA